jgi:hypothetical protein
MPHPEYVDIPKSGNPDDFKTGVNKLAILSELVEELGAMLKDGNPEAWNYFLGVRKRAEDLEGRVTLAEQIEDWIEGAEPVFTVNQCYTDLRVRDSVSAMGNVRGKFSRMVDKGEIEWISKGMYRKVDKNAEEIKWWEVTDNNIDLRLPLKLHESVYIYPGNMIVFAGVPNTGKTAVCVETIGLNVDNLPIGKHIYWWNSDSAKVEIHRRIMADDGVDTELWRERVKIFERSQNFQDVIVPNSLNIFDYMAVNDPTEVGKMLDPIHEKLKLVNSVAIICLQKVPGSAHGRGGTPTLDRPRLYVNLDPVFIHNRNQVRARIVKAKNKRIEGDLTNHCKTFVIEDSGRTIVETGEWKYVPLDNWKKKT